MATSESYQFQNTPADDLIQEAFERCGEVPSMVTGERVQSAINSANLMLSEWSNMPNLSTIYPMMVSLEANQSHYPLPQGIYDIIDNEMTTVQYKRLFEGTASTDNGGDAANAFDGDPDTNCTNTTSNGYIAYTFTTTPQEVFYIGVKTNVTRTYKLAYEYSIDGSEWITLNTPAAQKFQKGTTSWYLPQMTRTAMAWRIRETGGAILDINELYFAYPGLTNLMQRMSRDQYMSYTNKANPGASTGRPTLFYIDRKRDTNLILYPRPGIIGSWNAIVFNAQKYYQDFNALVENVDMPQRFLEAFVAGWAARIAEKFYPERYPMLKQRSMESYALAAMGDCDSAPVIINAGFDY